MTAICIAPNARCRAETYEPAPEVVYLKVSDALCDFQDQSTNLCLDFPENAVIHALIFLSQI